MLVGVEVDELLYRMGGVAQWRTLVREASASQARTALTRGRIVRIGYGTYGLPGGDEARVAAQALNGALSLTSAALHHGWAVKVPPRTPHVTVPRDRKVAPRRRRGVQLHYADVEVDGIATTPLQTVTDCARWLPFDEALCVADSALRAGLSREALIAAAEQSPRTGRSRAVRVAEAADGRAANPFESSVRGISKEVPGVALEPQVFIPGYGRPDLYDEALGLVVECDSFQFHSDSSAVVNDVERYNDCALQDLTLLRFAWEHPMFRQEYVLHTLRAWVEQRAASSRPAVQSPCPRCAA